MKIKITRQTFIKGELVKAGDIVEVSDRDGKYLIAIGKAVPDVRVKKDEPVFSLESLDGMGDKELFALAKKNGIETKGLSRDDCILELVDLLSGGN